MTARVKWEDVGGPAANIVHEVRRQKFRRQAAHLPPQSRTQGSGEVEVFKKLLWIT
jgi:hypothetical protein